MYLKRTFPLHILEKDTQTNKQPSVFNDANFIV